MTTYYVRKTGSDGADGLSPSTAWATIGKALGASGISSGDSVFVGAGVYRETVTVAMTSAVAETFVIADVDGSQTGDVGEVVWSNYTTDDQTQNFTPLLDTAQRDWLTFVGISFVAGWSIVRSRVSGGNVSTHISLIGCSLVGYEVAVEIWAIDGPVDWLIDGCHLWNIYLNDIAFEVFLNRNETADYDAGVTLVNSVVIGYDAILIRQGSAGTFKGGGVDVKSCTIFHTARGVATNDANLSTSIPCTVENSLFFGLTGISAFTSGQIVEDYNQINAGLPRENVDAGANSADGFWSPRVHLGHEFVIGAQPRPFGMPMAGAPFLGFGNASGGPTTDILGNPRPPTVAQRGIGAYERNDTAQRETTTTHTGSNALRFDGPGVHDFDVPVSPPGVGALTVSVQARYDSTYAGTLPQLRVLNGGEAGVADATDTMVAAANTWEELSVAATPSSAGIVTVRFQSNDTDGGGKAFFDSFSVS